MLFINEKTNEYPRFQGDIELLGWTLGSPLPKNWAEVQEAAYPKNVPADSKVVELAPELVAGKWVQKFEIQPLSAQELAFRDAPATAKAKLAALGLTDVEIEALSRGLVR
jgi:hypothetical protein